ncbi:MAG: BNR-4 repeat-containing protein [Pirellulaceae bacterium]
MPRGPLQIFSLLLLFLCATVAQAEEPAEVRTVDGYRGIWFTLGQKSEHGDKYSGGLGTYTAKHRPLAIYSKEADKTFFVYGGTPAQDRRYLLAMIGCYDHATGKVAKPVVVHDKGGVDDPHDNPSITMDDEGYLWVFVSGRGRSRPGFIYRSNQPHDINGFELVSEQEMTYPQPWYHPEHGFLHLFTKYTNGREAYWANSKDGKTWTETQKLASIGRYQSSEPRGERVVTAMNVHVPPMNVDARTNLYVLETPDWGKTWQQVDGKPLKLPIEEGDGQALVRDYQSEGRLVYLKDVNFDADGNPIILYITSGDFKPGPGGEPRTWTIAHWTGEKWLFHEIAPTTHNYDMGSLYVEEDGTWRIIAPTQPGPSHWGTGGEVAIHTSTDQGKTWKKIRDVTTASPRNHGYVRRPVDAHPDFYAFWADGNPDEMTTSKIYFTNQAGDKVLELPYEMEGDWAEPKVVSEVTPPRRRVIREPLKIIPVD